MYRGMTLACPACGGALEYTTASLPVHGCRGCGGMWLGPDAAMHVLQGRGGALENRDRPVGRARLAAPDRQARRAGRSGAPLPLVRSRDGAAHDPRCPCRQLPRARDVVRSPRGHARDEARLIELHAEGEAATRERLVSRPSTIWSTDTKIIAEAGAKAIAGLGVTIIAEFWTWLSTHHHRMQVPASAPASGDCPVTAPADRRSAYCVISAALRGQIFRLS